MLLKALLQGCTGLWNSLCWFFSTPEFSWIFPTVASSLNATSEAKVCSCTDGHLPNLNRRTTDDTCGQNQHGYSTWAFLLLATAAPWQEILRCYHGDIPQGSFMHGLWAHEQVQVGMQKQSYWRRGWWGVWEKTKARWHSYFHLHYYNYIGGTQDVINFILKCLITDETAGSPKADAPGIFPLASWSPDLKNCQILFTKVQMHVLFTLFQYLGSTGTDLGTVSSCIPCHGTDTIEL